MSENTTDPAIDEARNAFLATFAEEPEDETPAEGEAVEAAEGAADDVQPASETPPADPVEPSEPAKEQPEPETRAYRRLLAGEAKLREDKKAIEAERKALEADRAALAEWRAAQAALKADPVAYLRKAGLDQKEILAALKEAHERDLGDLAPADVRAALAARDAERIAKEAEERLRKVQEEATAQAFIADYQRGITQFVGSGLSEFPHLATMASAGKPVAQALYETAVEMAAANPNGPAPNYKAVAAELNSRLSEFLTVLSPVAAPPAQAASSADPTTPAGKPVLRNSSTQAQPAPATEPKPSNYAEYREQLRSSVLARYGIT